MSNHLVLGLDASTQSLTAVLVDRESGQLVLEHSVTYPPEIWMPVEHEGQADQSAVGFVLALEQLLTDLVATKAPLHHVERIGVSAQQHGCVFLGLEAEQLLGTLQNPDVRTWKELAEGLFSHPRAPIWMTSDTTAEANALRVAAGGSQAMIALTGSDSPLRFTGAMIRRFASEHPRRYERTSRVALLSQLFPMLLTGSIHVPVDWGNGSGTSLMDYHARVWSPALVEACAQGLGGGTGALASKLGSVASPQTLAGKIAAHFVRRFGFSSDCEVLIGSGDNPQSKVLVEGDLLSLGTSFVLMASEAFDPRGWGNSMYDGLGRPFAFGCRTNGALVWDGVRTSHGADFVRAEAALKTHGPGSVLGFSQPHAESFPPSPVVASVAGGHTAGESFERAWAASVDSQLGLLFLGSRPWLKGKTAPLALTGGPASSAGIVRRVAAFSGRPVRVIGTGGAALGAAAAAHALGRSLPNWLPGAELVKPDSAEVEALHAPGAYLDQLKELFQATTGIDPTGERT